MAAAFLLLAGPALSQTINWASLTGSEIVDSGGAALEENMFLFELGAFEEGFVPDEQNAGDWLANWRVFDVAEYATGGVGMGSYFTGTEEVGAATGYAGVFQGLQAYLFIRDVSGTEFFLAGAASWIFPEKGEGCCPHGLVTEWSVSDLGDDPPVWGSQTGHRGSGVFSAAGPYDIQTHAVPETRVLLFAAAGCLLFFPRRRVA